MYNEDASEFIPKNNDNSITSNVEDKNLLLKSIYPPSTKVYENNIINETIYTLPPKFSYAL
ncbi:hypothetical protein NCCP28_36050 [Niallia sp. NCCP-28]|nr:hypothetical protein NCCP28_36050 [Niallia sp. NCCP-28]